MRGSTMSSPTARPRESSRVVASRRERLHFGTRAMSREAPGVTGPPELGPHRWGIEIKGGTDPRWGPRRGRESPPTPETRPEAAPTTRARPISLDLLMTEP